MVLNLRSLQFTEKETKGYYCGSRLTLITFGVIALQFDVASGSVRLFP